MTSKNITVVLLHGPSGSGKTSIAKAIAAPRGVISPVTMGDTTLVTDHKSFAAPLVELHTIKTETIGNNSVNRQLWMLNQVLLDLAGPFSMAYDDFIEFVYDAQAWPIKTIKNLSDEIVRDRDFMTGFADHCHSKLDNPFAKSLWSNIYQDSTKFYNSVPTDSDYFHYVVFVSDLRLMPEYELVRQRVATVGGDLIMIRFKLDEDEQSIRLKERDGFELTETQASHPTQISPFSDDMFDLIIDSGKMTYQNQLETVKEFTLSGLLPKKV